MTGNGIVSALFAVISVRMHPLSCIQMARSKAEQSKARRLWLGGLCERIRSLSSSGVAFDGDNARIRSCGSSLVPVPVPLFCIPPTST